jgi:transposase
LAVLVEEALASRPPLRSSIEPLLLIWRAAREAAAATQRRLRARAGANCCRLMTSLGVGPSNALAFTSAIDDPSRFHDSRAVGASLGLMP